MHTVAIIGAGLMGRWHLETARSLGARVLAVIDPDLDAANRLAARAPGAKAYDGLEAVLDTDDVRVAHLCTPLETHRHLVLRLIAGGVHAFVEKPFTETAEEAQDLLQRANHAQVQICPVHQYAFQAAMDRAVARLPVLGRPRRLDINICSAGAGDDPSRRNEIVADILPHPISILQRLRPDLSVEKLAWQTQSSGPGEFFATSCTGELLVSFFISLNVRPTCFEINIQAEGGSIELDGFHGFSIEKSGEASRSAKVMAPFSQSARRLFAASTNLANRALQNEKAYAGLRALTRRFYESVAAGENGLKPISDETILASARLRDLLVSRLGQA